VDLSGEPEPQDLPAGALEGVGGRVVRRPLRDDAVEEGLGLRRQVRRPGRAGRLLGVHGVEPAVAPELGVERHEAEALPETAAGEELRGEGRADVEVDPSLPRRRWLAPLA
jgi:hypothetical protein